MESHPNTKLLFETTSLMDASFNILLVEDNPGDVVLIKEFLKSSGIDFSLWHVSSLKETLKICKEREFDVMLLDLGLPDSRGLETLKKIQLHNMKSPVVVMTGLDDEDIALASLREGAQDYLVKNRLTPDTVLRGIKYGIERKKGQDLLRKNAKQFSVLSSTTAAINECEDITSIYTVTCQSITQLFNTAAVLAIELENSVKIHTSRLELIEPWFDQIKQETGFDLINPLKHAGDTHKEVLDLFRKGKLHKINIETGSSPGDDLKRNGFKISGRVSGINAYAIGFIRNEKIFGGMMIFGQNNFEADDISIIETISNQVSLCLQRKTIEKDLKSSESRYRRLNRELETKVKERTHDLETSNYQLNQELIERHIAEEALKTSEARLKELNATKDKFFNIIAHDLKNPFTCLLGATELLNQNLAQMDTEQIKELVHLLNESAKSGYAILQNLLDWSRSQTGLITLNPEKIELKSMIAEQISDLCLQAVKKEIELISDVEKEMFVLADKNMINTILRNLLANAIKFTPRFGKVTVSAVIKRKIATISVRDTGIGISQDNIKKLFRIDIKYTRPGTNKELGTGLGLILCKEFAEIQGGKIWVESIINKGSKFIFSIPVKAG